MSKFKKINLYFLLFVLLFSLNAVSKEIVIKDSEFPKLSGYNYSIIRHSNFGFYIIEISEAELNKLPFLKYREKKNIIKKKNLPNDSSLKLDKIWAIANMHLSTLWDNNTNCANVKIAVVDTGVDYNHEDLKDNILVNSGEIPDNGIDDDGNGFVDDYYGYNFAYNNGNPIDDDTDGVGSHGTHVAGIAAAVGNNGVGITGVCWKASLIPVKALDYTGSGDPIDVADGIDYAIKRGAKIINLSVEVQDYFQSLELAVKKAYENGVIIVCAAGNASLDLNSKKSYFASFREKYPNVINVASYNSNDVFSSFSNYGALTVDIAAPGNEIYSTLKNNNYGYQSGSSMATGYVTGLIANILSFQGVYDFNEVRAKIIHAAKGDLFKGKTVSGGEILSYKIFDNVTEPILFSTKTAPAKNEKIIIKGYNLKNTSFYDSSNNPLKVFSESGDNATIFAPSEKTYIYAENNGISSNKLLIEPADKFYLYLEKEWNLISIPVYSYSGVNSEFFDEQEVESIWEWTGEKWSVWSPKQDIMSLVYQYGVPVLSKLYSGKGYWLKSNTAFTELFSGNSYGAEQISLSTGWNLVGTGKLINISSIYNLDSNIKTVWKWNGNSWKVDSPDNEISELLLSYDLQPFQYIYPGEGFWVHK